jgi:hypothetical protein
LHYETSESTSKWAKSCATWKRWSSCFMLNQLSQRVKRMCFQEVCFKRKDF